MSMRNPNDRIPDDMAAEVLAEAARLYAQANKGYSFADLERACMEAQIPSHVVWEAIRNIEQKRSRSGKQIKRGIFIGIILLISAIASWSMTNFVTPSNRESPLKTAPPPSMPVKISTVQTGMIEDSSIFIASVNSRRSVTLLPPIEGQITRIFVNAGDTVAEGDAIMELVPTKQQRLQHFKISDPHAGMVDDIPVKEGELVNTSSKLTTIVQNQPLEVNISVPADYEPRLRKGVPVEVINAQIRRSLGITKVFFISPSVNSYHDTILIKALFDNSKGELRTGQLIEARVIWDQRPGILIPATAVSHIGGQDWVYVAQSRQSSQGKLQLLARQKAVKLGNIQGTNYQVLQGLQPGDRIIVSQLLNLRDGIPIIPES